MLPQAVYQLGIRCQSDQDCAQQLLNRLQRAINQRNWPLFLSCFTEDAVLVNLFGQRLKARTELVSYQQQEVALHQDRLWNYQLLQLKQLDLNTFLINAEQHWHDREGRHSSGLSSAPLYVVKRQGFEWKICAGNML